MAKKTGLDFLNTNVNLCMTNRKDTTEEKPQTSDLAVSLTQFGPFPKSNEFIWHTHGLITQNCLKYTPCRCDTSWCYNYSYPVGYP